MTDRFYTTTQAAAMLGIGREMVRRTVIARGLGQKHGGVWLLTPAEVEQLRTRRDRGRPPKEG